MIEAFKYGNNISIVTSDTEGSLTYNEAFQALSMHLTLTKEILVRDKDAQPYTLTPVDVLKFLELAERVEYPMETVRARTFKDLVNALKDEYL